MKENSLYELICESVSDFVKYRELLQEDLSKDKESKEELVRHIMESEDDVNITNYMDYVVVRGIKNNDLIAKYNRISVLFEAYSLSDQTENLPTDILKVIKDFESLITPIQFKVEQNKLKPIDNKKFSKFKQDVVNRIGKDNILTQWKTILGL